MAMGKMNFYDMILKKITNYKRFDLPIRILYSRLYFKKIMNIIFKNYGSKSDYNDLNMRFGKMFPVMATKFEFDNKIILELGPGNSYLNAYYFIYYGAKKVYLIDKYPRMSTDRKQKDYEKEELNYIKEKFGLSNNFFDENRNRIIFIQGDIANLTLPDNVDFIYSNSVFEHIRNYMDVFKKLNLILNKGGYIWSYVDLRDHYNTKIPYLFLKYGKFIWETFLTKEGVSYTNRLRVDDWRKLFGTNKFRILYEAAIGKKGDCSGIKVHPLFKNTEYWIREYTFFIQKEG